MCTGECQTKNFGLNHESPHLFVTAKCGPNCLYPVWTIFWLLYHLAIVGYDVYITMDKDMVTDYHWLLYVSSWSYVLLTFSCFIEFLTTVYVHCSAKHLLDKYTNHPMPCYLKFQWMLFTTSSVVAFLTTGAYYGTLAYTRINDLEEASIARDAYEFRGLAINAGNSGFVLLHLLFSAKPVRYLHVYMPMIYCIVYSVFMVAYQHIEDEVVYDIYDWNDPYVCITILVAALVVVVPIVHLIVFVIVKIRNCCCCCGSQVAPSPEGNNGVAPKSYLDQIANARWSRNMIHPDGRHKV